MVARPLPPPRRRPGPNWETSRTKGAPGYSSLSKWGPPFAGMEEVLQVSLAIRTIPSANLNVILPLIKKGPGSIVTHKIQS